MKNVRRILIKLSFPANTASEMRYINSQIGSCKRSNMTFCLTSVWRCMLDVKRSQERHHGIGNDITFASDLLLIGYSGCAWFLGLGNVISNIRLKYKTWSFLRPGFLLQALLLFFIHHPDIVLLPVGKLLQNDRVYILKSKFRASLLLSLKHYFWTTKATDILYSTWITSQNVKNIEWLVADSYTKGI